MNLKGKYLVMEVMLLCTCCAAVPQSTQDAIDGTLTGRVADFAEGAPIPYAFVLVHNGINKKEIPVSVDKGGGYKLHLRPGLYDVFVAAEGFSPSCRKVQVRTDRTTNFTAKLRPDTSHLQTGRQ